MKKLLGALMCLAIPMMILVASVSFISCNQGNDAISSVLGKTQKDTAFVYECVYSVVTPEFSDVTEVIQCQQTLNSNAYVDSVFTSMPEDVLKNVATVLLKKAGRATKKAIVNEYIGNRDIYQNLPTPPAVETETTTPLKPVATNSETTVTEGLRPGGKGKVQSESYQVKDTTIDGKKADVVTKTTIYE